MINIQTQLQRTSAALHGFALKLTGDASDADDLFQETLVRIFLNKNRFEENSNFKAWAITIMRNTFINEYRKKARRRTIINQPPTKSFLNRNAKIVNMGENNLACEDLYGMIDALSPKYRIPFNMVYEGYKYDEIADMMNLPIGTIKSRVFFARKKLMVMYNEHYLSRA